MDGVDVDHEREEERGGVGRVEEGSEEAGIKNWEIARNHQLSFR